MFEKDPVTKKTMWRPKHTEKPPQVIFEDKKMSVIFPDNASGLWTIWENPKKAGK